MPELFRIYARVIRQDPRLASEVIPRMARSCREVGGASELSSILSELIAEHASARDAIALAAIRDEQIQNLFSCSGLRAAICCRSLHSRCVDRY